MSGASVKGRSARRRGHNFERAIAKRFTKAGAPAHRVPLSGAVEGYPGDVAVDLPGERIVLEAKVRKTDFVMIRRWLAGNDAVVLGSQRQSSLVVMELDRFIGILTNAGLITPAPDEE